MAGSKRRLLTPEQESWLAARYAEHTNEELSRALMDEFGVALSNRQLAAWAKRNGCAKSAETRTRTRRECSRRVYSAEMRDFLREFVPGHIYGEVNDEFERRFGWRMSHTQYKNIKLSLGVVSGVPAGRFRKGHAPYNKGMTWDEMGLSPEAQAKLRKNTYRKGHAPHNAYHRLLDERMGTDGVEYVYVKPRNAKWPAQHWISKSRFVWMQQHGRDFPVGHRCVHADHDNGNYSADNLVAVPDEIYVLLTGRASTYGLDYWDRETLDLAIVHARLVRRRIEIERKRPRRCEVCGSVFVPSKERQRFGERVRTCEECRAKGLRAPARRRRVGTEDT